ncbi:GNAT family N-acetyltransferase [Nocardia sp. NPDC006044]|uniref:GNAT family N-acetyltransferase n=1 Tax=Nocardia sp. NPDC006044 TaxID=3364306 RepID=UPI00368E787A
MPSSLTITIKAGKADAIDLLIELSREFYSGEEYPFDERAVRSALRQLCHDSRYGEVWLVHSGSHVAGYATVTFGFSIEFGGRFTLLDELYIRPGFRGKGLGGHFLQLLIDDYAGQGFGAMRLEVEQRNHRAIDMYDRLGFYRHKRSMMTKSLSF